MSCFTIFVCIFYLIFSPVNGIFQWICIWVKLSLTESFQLQNQLFKRYVTASSSGRVDTRNYTNSEKTDRDLEQDNMQIHNTLNSFPRGKIVLHSTLQTFWHFLFSGHFWSVNEICRFHYCDARWIQQIQFNKYNDNKNRNLTAFLMDKEKVFEKAQRHFMAKTLKKLRIEEVNTQNIKGFIWQNL